MVMKHLAKTPRQAMDDVRGSRTALKDMSTVPLNQTQKDLKSIYELIISYLFTVKL